MEEKKQIIRVVLDILFHSLEDVCQYDAVNISDDVSEWNMCARLAMYVENRMRAFDFLNRTKLFNGYYVDVEYNRSKDGNMKIVDNQPVRPDLLIQTREETMCNYLVLETKKKKNNQQREKDEREIKRMVSPREEGEADFYNCGTLCGVFLDYNKEGYKGKICWYDEEHKQECEMPFDKESIMHNFLNSLFA